MYLFLLALFVSLVLYRHVMTVTTFSYDMKFSQNINFTIKKYKIKVM